MNLSQTNLFKVVTTIEVFEKRFPPKWSGGWYFHPVSVTRKVESSMMIEDDANLLAADTEKLLTEMEE